MFTSFAAQYDAAGYKIDIDPMNPPPPRAWGLTRAQATTPKPAAKTRRLGDDFETASTKEQRRRDGASQDGQIGSMILDTFFNAAFPGLGMIFSPLALTDAAEVYDQTRDAFRRASRPGQNRGQSPAQMANARRQMNQAPHHAFAPRRPKTGLFSFIFG